MPLACTIVARNYLAHARVLARSLAEHAAGMPLYVLVTDGDVADTTGTEPFTLVGLAEIGLDDAETRRLAAFYDVTELATAVKPRFLQYLRDTSADVVLYFDPDIELHGPPDAALALAQSHGIVLTPHTLVPIPDDGLQIGILDLMIAGVFNLGFAGVGPGSDEFLSWWWQHTRRGALIDPGRGMFTDQRWIDMAPCLFDPAVLKDPGYNVAYWNLHGRPASLDHGRVVVGGAPLVFFHFSGFDHRVPHLLSKHQGARPRILLSDSPVVARLCRDYADRLLTAGVERAQRCDYGWSRMRGGMAYGRRMRDVYREALNAHERDDAYEPPNPFDPHGPDAFLDWLRMPDPMGPPTLSRYAANLYRRRVDLQVHFPDIAGADAEGCLHWLRTGGVSEEHMEPSVVAPPPAAPATRTVSKTGIHGRAVSIAGYQQAAHGVGEAFRLLTCAAAAAGLQHDLIDCERSGTDARSQRGPDHVDIWCVNADMTPPFARRYRGDHAARSYTAGYWFWELDQFPASMHEAFDYVDEVWTATTFVERSLRAAGRRPVHRVPLPIPMPRPPSVRQMDLQPAGAFTFLFMFDYLSGAERKNVSGLITAFERAFPREGDARLIIKTMNASMRRAASERVRLSTCRRDIVFVDRVMRRPERDALLAGADAYVSLHRSEGLGLTMAEAMALGKPVIATGYSGNADFMSAANSFLVDYTTTSVPAGCEPYPIGARWADPDLDHAAACLQRVRAGGRDVAARAQLGRQHILTRHSPEIAGAALMRRLAAIRDERRARVVVSHDRTDEPVADRRQFSATLSAAEHRMTPLPAVPADTTLGPLRLAGQRAWFRMLRPLWWQQRASQLMLAGALRSLEARTAALESEVDAARAEDEASTAVDAGRPPR